MSEKERQEIFAPHIPAGVIEIGRLKEIVEKLEETGAKEVKLTGELIFVLGQEKLSKKVEKSLPYPPSHYGTPGVRGIKACSATSFCNRYHQDVLSLALKLDELYYAIKLPMKLTIGLSGCERSCSEPATKDIGIISQKNGFKILIGGNAGFNPAIGRELVTLKTPDEVINLVGRIIEFCKVHGRRLARLGKLVEEKGEDFFKESVFKK